MKPLLLALLCAGLSLARAESFKVRVAHETRAGAVTLPAGDYYIHTPAEGSPAPRVLIASPDGREVEVAVTVSNAAAAKPGLVTVREGRDRYWREIRVGGRAFTFEAPLSSVDVSSGL